MSRWSKDKAVNYLMKYTILNRKSLETEVARYITWPGQACSYKIGEMKIKELRRKAEILLGNYKQNHGSPTVKTKSVEAVLLEMFHMSKISSR